MQWPSQPSTALERWEGEVSQAEAGSSHLEPPTAPKGPYSEQVELMMGGKYDAHSCQCAPQPSNHVKAFVELNSDALSWKLASARSPSCCSKVLAAGIANHMKLHSELLPWSSFAMAQSPGQSPLGTSLPYRRHQHHQHRQHHQTYSPLRISRFLTPLFHHTFLLPLPSQLAFAPSPLASS